MHGEQGERGEQLATERLTEFPYKKEDGERGTQSIEKRALQHRLASLPPIRSPGGLRAQVTELARTAPASTGKPSHPTAAGWRTAHLVARLPSAPEATLLVRTALASTGKPPQPTAAGRRMAHLVARRFSARTGCPLKAREQRPWQSLATRTAWPATAGLVARSHRAGSDGPRIHG